MNYAFNIKNKSLIHIFMKEFEVLPKLLPNIYTIEEIQESPFTKSFQYIETKLQEELIRFKTGISNDIITSVSSFLSKKTVGVYKELKMTHKMGCILYGPPGTGKTCTALIAMKELSEKYNAICLVCDGTSLYIVQQAIKAIRKNQNNPIVLFFDEFDGYIKSSESAFLQFLDGSTSVNNCILMGCTNYLDKIPDRIKYRKSRIKDLFEVKSFPYEVYQHYIQTKLPSFTKEELHEFCHFAMENVLSLDQLKHSVLEYKLSGGSVEKIIKNIKEQDQSSGNTLPPTIYITKK